MDDLGYISVPALQQYVKSAESMGLRVADMLAAAGVTPEILVDNNARLPGMVLQKLIRHVVSASGNQLFGLQTSHHIEPGFYHVMGYIAMSSSSISEAISHMMAYEKLVGDMGTSHIEFEPGLVVVRWKCRYGDAIARRHILENVLASWAVFTRWLADNESLTPHSVRFEHSAPEDRSLLREYQKVFGCPVLFDQPVSALVTTPDMLSQRLRLPDNNLRETLEMHARSLLDKLHSRYTLSQQVASLLRAMLADGCPRKELIAEQLGINERTLHRKLADEGGSYQKLLDDVRLEMAVNYLREGRLTVEEIAHRVGFAESRSFIRHFKSFHGVTPGDYRDRLKEGARAEAMMPESARQAV